MLCKSVVIVICFSFISITVSASKILAIVATPSYSHQLAFIQTWIALSLKGHEVTLITTDPINDPKLTNLKQIDVSGSYKLMDDFYKKVHNVSQLESSRLLTNTFDDVFDLQLSNDSVKKLISNESRFDVVICEAIYFEYQALSDLYNCPKILIASLEPFTYMHGLLGNPINPAVTPDISLPYVAGKMNFVERLISISHSLLYQVYKWTIHFPKRHAMLKRHFGNSVRHPSEIFRDTDLVLINLNPLIADIRTVGPNVIYFGGGAHMFPLKPLPKDLQDFLDDAKEGCIYFSLGSNTKSIYMGKDKIQVILDTLGELPYKILWKFELPDTFKPPKNIKLLSWAPQQDILRHPNIKLFITQGGFQSLEESIISHVPMVMLPVYGDQKSNALRMEQRGMARIVPHKPMPNKEEFKSIILDVISNPKYKENVIKTAELLLDQPMTGVEKAVWWIEYVIRHKGAKHLRNPAMDIPAYQYYCLDIIGVIVSFFYIIFKIFCLILRISCKSKATPIVNSKKKKR